MCVYVYICSHVRCIYAVKYVYYLDVNMEIRCGDLATRVYGKRDVFNFEMTKILHFSSNVHIYAIYNVNIFLNGINRTERLSSIINGMMEKF